MNVTCPECASVVDGEPGAEMVCPACMSMFTPPRQVQGRSNLDVPEERSETRQRGRRNTEPRRPSRPPGPASRSWEVQLVDGSVQRGLSRYSIREEVYLGHLPNTSRVRRNDGEWEAIGRIPEFAQIFHLLGTEPVPGPVNRKIAGWRPDDVANPPPMVPRAGVVAALGALAGAAAPARAAGVPRNADAARSRQLMIGGAAGVLVLGLLLYFLFAAP